MTTMTVPPTRSLEQRLDALAKANTVRITHARAKRQLAAGERTFRELLIRQELETMHVADLVLAVRGVGKVKRRRILKAADVSPSKTLGGLTSRQRRDLVASVALRGNYTAPHRERFAA